MPASNSCRLSFLGVVLLVCLAQICFEGSHWQMLPAYVAGLFSIPIFILPPFPQRWKSIQDGSILVLVVISCGLTAVLPVFSLPALTGDSSIGTMIVPMTDRSRWEEGRNNQKSNRRLITQFWYPAAKSWRRLAPYRRRGEATLTSSYMSVDWTDARYDAPIKKLPLGYPVIIYNPGWNGRRTQDSFLTEDLASHGYLVVAIDHPYNSSLVDLGDGRIIQSLPTPQFADEVSSKAEIYSIINKEVEKETVDTLFVIDELERINLDPSSFFFKTIDLSKIGALGYSLGGAVAAESAHQSSKIRSVVDLDTPLYGRAGREGVVQPFLLVSEDLSHSTPAERARMSYGRRRNMEMDEDDYARQLKLLQRSGDYQFSLHGSLHTSFQDSIFYSPLQSISGAGMIDPMRCAAILRQYVLAFFDQTLREEVSPLLAQPTSPFPEVGVRYRSAVLTP